MTHLTDKIGHQRNQGEFMSSFRRVVIAGLVLVTTAMSTGADIVVKQGSFSLSGMVEIETAEMMKARTAIFQKNTTMDHNWYSHLSGTLNFQAKPINILDLRGSFEFKQYMNMSAWWATSINRGAYNLGDFLYNDFFIREAQGIISAVNRESFSLSFSLGLQPYKYNTDGREFGEYLFRSGTYPFLLMGEFDRPFSRLTGLRTAISHTSKILTTNLDLFALTERELRPYWDISLAGVGSVNILKIFEIGGGVNLAHFIPMNDKYVTPHSEKNMYIKDSSMVFNPDYGIEEMTYDTGYYTFKGTKLMARASIDLFGIFGLMGYSRGDGSVLSDIFGLYGGKIFGEIGVIGVENYPKSINDESLGYESRSQREPWVAGFHIPMWKILDDCALEFERYPNHYPNNSAWVYVQGLPLPFTDNISDDYPLDRGPRWYWSLYLKKQVVKNFTIVGQFGRDHLRWEMPMPYYNSNYDFEEAMCKPDQWGWHIKTIFNF